MFRKIIGIFLVLSLIGYTGYEKFIKEKEAEKGPTAQEVFASQGLEVGKKAPDFELQTLDGKKTKLSDLKGKKVILNFWATWCPPCKKELPEMQKFNEKHGEDVTILAVNYTISEKGKAQGVQQFATEQGITFPILLDTDSSVSNMYKIITIPTSYFIDSKGIIRQKFIGPMTENFMEKTVKKMK
ncbi:TlpA disulfide reductase family protein [Bacillus sp. 165]|uniref:peroxiredoxin family protein n=1 Tax=Bacillus sp. 165 TaxID=1529117 RepID=UPI001AD99541|nr:TlpA disulfide reductase family protein [Bacillus sp. 165]MBO9129051.1 TlpA family protein disulfide reductase [Bacillus sp. 165]